MDREERSDVEHNRTFEGGQRMMENRVKEALKNGKAAVGARIVETATLGVVKIFADAGLDWVWMDCEHGGFGMETVLDFCRYSRAIGLCPVVKVPTLDRIDLSRPLDQGALGVIVPMIETAEQARLAVKYTRYPPLGERGCGLDNSYMGWTGSAPDYIRWANDSIILILQVESTRAVENIDEIAAVDGVDVLLVGPLDLSVSLGIPGDIMHPRTRESIQSIADACARSGRVFGYPGNVENGLYWWKRGALFLSIGGDTAFLASGCSMAVGMFRDKAGG